MVPPPPSWVLDLQNGPPSRPKNTSSIPDPPGYTSSRAVTGKQKSQAPARKPPTPEETETLKLKKAWEVALGPAKQLPMQAIMGYMSGNSLQIFSIMMVFML
jgi:ER membrane protein complex subunit 4